VASGMMSSVDRFVRLPARDKALLVECWWELAVAAVAIRIRPRMLAVLAREGSPRGAVDTQGTDVDPRRLLESVDRAASHHVKPMTCLERAVALQRVLCRRGVGARLEIGARKSQSGWEAHAWVSIRGQRLDSQQGLFQTLRPVSVSV
jgi:hypothetical protein